MSKKVSKRSALLLGALMALCAFVMPPMAPAASWTPTATGDGVIDSINLGFSATIIGTPTGWSCRNTRFNVNVDNAAVATITGASFQNCHVDLGFFSDCTITHVGTGFPWKATALSTSNIQIHGINIDVRFETTPPAGTFQCIPHGTDMSLTGNLSGVTYTPVAKTFHFGDATGLTMHIAALGLSGLSAAAHGTASATGLLNILM